VKLLVGAYEWDDAARVATLTPFDSMRHNFSSLMQAAGGPDPAPRTQPIIRKKKGK